jgi:hypothetical protein
MQWSEDASQSLAKKRLLILHTNNESSGPLLAFLGAMFEINSVNLIVLTPRI